MLDLYFNLTIKSDFIGKLQYDLMVNSDAYSTLA